MSAIGTKQTWHRGWLIPFSEVKRLLACRRMDAIAEADRALYCLDRAGRGPSLATGEVHPPQTYPDRAVNSAIACSRDAE